MCGRVLAAVCRGAFFGIGSVVAANMVADDRKAGAIAVMFTGLTVTLTDVSHFASTSVPWLPILFAGNLFGGKAAGRSIDRTLIAVLAVLILVLVTFALTAHSRPATIVALVAMGAAGFGKVPSLQMRVMTFADDASTMASAANIGAFNLGNALGAQPRRPRPHLCRCNRPRSGLGRTRARPRGAQRCQALTGDGEPVD